jgi:putative addiction module component (TIGR02574 family)
MTPTIQSLGIDRLPRDQRLALVQDIWNTIASEPVPPLLTEAQRRELERRIAEDDASPGDVIPWEQVKAHALSRLRGARRIASSAICDQEGQTLCRSQC